MGTDNQQAGTLMHEMGHTLMLTHGGARGNPNCAPNYLSVMNYLFQLRGLQHGALDVDYSGAKLGPLFEDSLFEVDGLDGPQLYATSWYAPFAGIGTEAKRHCNGSAIGPGEPLMVRVDGPSIQDSIDWNADGDHIPNLVPSQDINFNGVLNDAGTPLEGFDDWASLRLNQVGSRRNIGVYYFADGFPYLGPASLGMTGSDFGKFDFGKFDFGKFDFGKFDFGKFDFGDLNVGDLGKFDFGKFDFGKFDFGKFDFGVGAGDLGRGSDGKGGFGKFDFGKFDFGGGGDGDDAGELTFQLAVEAGLLGPPTNVTACVVGDAGNPDACMPDPGGGLGVVLSWEAPDASPSGYLVYRAVDAGEPLVYELVVRVDPSVGAFSDFDVESASYRYYVAAEYTVEGDVNEEPSDTVTVSTSDTIAPVIAAHGPVGGVEATGPGGAIVNYLSPSTSDNVDPDGVADCGPLSGSTFPLGATTVTCDATDAAGNNAVSTMFTVSVVDTTAPAVTAPASITVEAEGPLTPATTAEIAAFLDAATAFDDVDLDVTASVSHDAPADFPLGDTLVTFSASDTATPINTGSAVATVTIVDTTAPAVTAPANIIVEAEGTLTPASTLAIADFLGAATALDAVDGNVTASVSHDAPADFPLGDTLVTFSASDTATPINTGSAVATVTVVDTTAPAVTAPASIIVEAEGTLTPASTLAIADFLGAATALDVVDGDVTASVSHDAPADFPLGDTLVTFGASDTATPINTGSAVATVTIVDTTAPAVTAPASIIVEAEGTLTPASTLAIADFLGAATALDVVDGNLTGAVIHDAPANFPLGVTVVTFSATDTATPANTGSAVATVTIVDTTAPAVTAPASTTAEAEGTLTSATTAAIATFLGDATALDVVDGDVTASVSHDAPADFPLGDTLVTFSASDTATPINTGSAVATVTIVDTTAPVIAAHGDVGAEATGLSGAIVSYVSPTTADIVDPAGVASCAPTSESLFARGTTTVTCNATDLAGNPALATTFTVSVVDTTPPTIATNGDLAVEATSASGAVVTFPLPVAFDAVGILSVACVPPSGSVFPFGATVVTCTATDLSGLSSASTFTITVTPPTLALLIDDEGIGGGAPPNFFSDVEVNADIADIGVRTQLRFFADNVGATITLPGGFVGDEGWFAIETIPSSWTTAGPTADGLRNFVGNPNTAFPHNVGPGLGTPDANGDSEALLDNIPDVNPLRATGLKLLEGRQVCAVVFKGDVSIGYDPLQGVLKGATSGTVAFEVLAVTASQPNLPEVEIKILEATQVCEDALTLFTDAPEPISSSRPKDVKP